jgi:hypothetical protein
MFIVPFLGVGCITYSHIATTDKLDFNVCNIIFDFNFEFNELEYYEQKNEAIISSQ